jgi:hypothetical protein
MSPILSNPPAHKQKNPAEAVKKWMEKKLEQIFSWQSHNYLSKISVSILKYLFLDLLLQHSFMSWKDVKKGGIT